MKAAIESSPYLDNFKQWWEILHKYPKKAEWISGRFAGAALLCEDFDQVLELSLLSYMADDKQVYTGDK